MNVRCKFRVLSVQHHYTPDPTKPVAEIKLAPVWEQDGPNRQWSEATPQGSISLMITKPGAVAAFDIGKQYFVDFSPAE